MSDEVSQADSRVEQLYQQALTLESVKCAREYLSKPPISDLPYHNEAHTLDVIREVALFAVFDELSDREQHILFAAAAWHDVGFSDGRREEHEEASARLFRNAFDEQKFSEIRKDDVRTIEQMILDTKVYVLPGGAGSEQQAKTELSKYLLDADLSNLGRADFFDCFERLLEETGGVPLDAHIATLGLISRHRWFTPTAESLRLEREMQNARILVERIKRLLKGGIT